jgi:hypothetical protein
MVNWGVKISMLSGIRTAFSNRAATLGSDWKPAAIVGVTLRMAKYATSSYPEDKVFGLCGLFSDSAKDQLMKFHGKDSEEVHFAATSYILQHDTCPNLYHEFPTLPKSKSKGKAPSWALDFSFTGSLYAEIGFGSLTKFDAPRSDKDKLQFSSDGREMKIDACIVDGIKDILRQEQVVQMPDTPGAWQQFLVTMFENDVLATLGLFSTNDPIENKRYENGINGVIERAQLPTLPNTIDGVREFWIRMLLVDTEKTLDLFMSTKIAKIVREYVNAVNFVTFLENAEKLHEQAASHWKGVETIPSFWSVILAGLPADHWKQTGMEIPKGEKIREDIDILLGRRDDLIPETSILGPWKVAAHALGLEESKAMSLKRCIAAPRLRAAIQQVMTPRSSDIRASFFVTGQGLCGVAMPGARVGDQVAIIFHGTAYEIPFILKEEQEKKYSMVCAANVSDNWTVLGEAQGTLAPQEIVIV